MEILLFPILSLYFLEHLLFLFGILKNMSRIHSLGEPAIPSVSLIVSAKNEEKIILRCVNSLINIQYPEGQMEILLVNDNSSDRTGEIMKEYSAKSGLKYFEPVGNIDGLKGKTNALAQAIKRTTGEIIFTTDADCIVKSSWIKEIINQYDDRTGVVCGFSIPQANNLFGGIQAFDWLYLLTVASGSAGLGDQLSCVGNNMSYRRRAYDDVGGYENIKFSVTEDFMLLQTIKKKTKWKTKFPVDINALSETLPCSTLGELYRQKKRWGRGGLDINWFGYLVGFIGWCTAAAIIAGWLFAEIKFYLIFFLAKIVFDLFFTLPVIIRLRKPKLLLYLIPFQFYFALYAFSLPFILLFDRSVIWKNQKL